eukprot:SAG31_NODE_1332_length_8743_cov_20.800810_6_plen_88_part_00
MHPRRASIDADAPNRRPVGAIIPLGYSNLTNYTLPPSEKSARACIPVLLQYRYPSFPPESEIPRAMTRSDGDTSVTSRDGCTNAEEY